MDYAYYLKGLVNFERGGTILDLLSERDLSELRQEPVVNRLQRLQIAGAALPGEQICRRRQQAHDLSAQRTGARRFGIASFYASREAWVAVVNRTKYILQNFQGASVIRDTLELQREAYQKLGLEDLARDTQRIIDLNFNQGS